VTQQTMVLRCTDLKCVAMGDICCLSCPHQKQCPVVCPTVKQYTDPAYAGCPHILEEVQ